MSWFWHVWCRVCGMFCGLNWEDIVACGQGLFRDGFGSKIGVYRYKNKKYNIRGHEKYRKYIKVQKYMKEYVIEHEKQ